MDRTEGGRDSPQDSKLLSGHGGAERGGETGEPPPDDDQVKFDPTPALPAVGDRAPATVELYPSYVRPPPGADDGGKQQEGQERETERGYEGGDRVRLLVGSFNVGNSPLTDLAPWLPYGGKGFDLIVVGLQESTYRPPRGARDSSPFQRTLSLSPSNSLSPIKTGGGGGGGGAAGGSSRSPLRWGAMQSGDPDDTPPPGAGLLASSSLSMSAETPPAPPLSSPPPPPSSGFLYRKRRGSISGGVGPGMAGAAATRGGVSGESQQRRRASVSSFEDMAGAAEASCRLKSPRGGGGGSRRGGRLGQNLVGVSKEKEGAGGGV
ncbi:hypothetical protein (Partial), partial [Ectocarpus siliculosus]